MTCKPTPTFSSDAPTTITIVPRVDVDGSGNDTTGNGIPTGENPEIPPNVPGTPIIEHKETFEQYIDLDDMLKAGNWTLDYGEFQGVQFALDTRDPNISSTLNKAIRIRVPALTHALSFHIGPRAVILVTGAQAGLTYNIKCRFTADPGFLTDANVGFYSIGLMQGNGTIAHPVWVDSVGQWSILSMDDIPRWNDTGTAPGTSAFLIMVGWQALTFFTTYHDSWIVFDDIEITAPDGTKLITTTVITYETPPGTEIPPGDSTGGDTVVEVDPPNDGEPIPPDVPPITITGEVEVEGCCDDTDLGLSSVRYDGTYCHPGSIIFSAERVAGTKPCFNPLNVGETPPDAPPPPPVNPPPVGGGDPPTPPPDDGNGNDDGDPTPPPTLPIVQAKAPTLVTQTSATLNGTADPQGTSCNARFEWGLTSAYGNLTTLTGMGAGVGEVDLSASISGLIPDTVYHYRITATNAGGTTNSIDRSFATLATPIQPPPPPAPNNLRFGQVMYGGLYRAGINPMPDVAQTIISPGFITALNKCRSAGASMVINPSGGRVNVRCLPGDPELTPGNPDYDPTAVVNGFSIVRWKRNISAAQTALPNANAYYNDGTLLCHQCFDDFGSGAAFLWNGRPPTNNEMDDCAKYSKRVTGWANVPCFIRGHFSIFSAKTNWLYVDGGWLQWHKRFGDPYDWFGTQINLGVKMKMGVMLGGNCLRGGGGPTSALGWGQSPDGAGAPDGAWGMSPAEIRHVFDAIRDFSGYAFGCAWWAAKSSVTNDTVYFDRSDIKAAFVYGQGLLAGKKRGPVNYR